MSPSVRPKMPLPQPHPQPHPQIQSSNSPRHVTREVDRRGSNERRESSDTVTRNRDARGDNNNLAKLPGVHVDLSKNDVRTWHFQ